MIAVVSVQPLPNWSAHLGPIKAGLLFCQNVSMINAKRNKIYLRFILPLVTIVDLINRKNMINEAPS